MERTGNSSSSIAAAGFSLIEVVLAIGVISVALVAILGLLPVALTTATDSQRETHAALIARAIYTDLNTRLDPKRFVVTSKDFDGKLTTESINLTNANEDRYLAYDADGQLMGLVGADTYSAGESSASYLVHLKIRPLGAGSTQPESSAGLSQIDVTVEAPAAAKQKSRTICPFVTYVRQGEPTPSPTPAP